MPDTVLHSRDIKMKKTGSRHEGARSLGEELDTRAGNVSIVASV